MNAALSNSVGNSAFLFCSLANLHIIVRIALEESIQSLQKQHAYIAVLCVQSVTQHFRQLEKASLCINSFSKENIDDSLGDYRCIT